MITETKLRAKIRDKVAEFGSYRKAEAALGINSMFLNEICNGKKPVSDAVADVFGYREVQQERVYEKIKK